MPVTLGSVVPEDVERMTAKLYVYDGVDSARKRSAFWALLVLASIIATAGVVADSTATVIGAMIVAPLMTPIIGTALAIVLADRRNMLRSIALVLAGAASVIAIAYLIGLMVQGDITAATNSQVAGRVSPRLIDLLAALATGVVGAFALVRSDISDSLPGVAIAISLVPPLSVVGLTLESGADGEAAGALLLFATNVAAIIVTGTVVLLLFRVREAAPDVGVKVGQLTGRTLAVVGAVLVVVAVPLTIGTMDVVNETRVLARATPVAEQWAEDQGWLVTEVSFRQGVLRVIALGPPPEIDEAALRASLDAAGLQDVDARVTLVIGGSKDLPAG